MVNTNHHCDHNYFRYFLQAADQLDCQWKLMKMGEEGVRTMVIMVVMVMMIVMIEMVMVRKVMMMKMRMRNRIVRNERD